MQFEVRVNVRDRNTREALDDYTEAELAHVEQYIESCLDEVWFRTDRGREILLTVANLRETT